jgi:hypothetical protein
MGKTRKEEEREERRSGREVVKHGEGEEGAKIKWRR